MSKLHVGYVRKAIEERFTGLIDMTDQARLGLVQEQQATVRKVLLWFVIEPVDADRG